jgi:hypothetical protein
VSISFLSQTGVTYTLLSTDTLVPSNWLPALGVSPANPLEGNGETLTFSVPATGELYFRVAGE